MKKLLKESNKYKFDVLYPVCLDFGNYIQILQGGVVVFFLFNLKNYHNFSIFT